MNSKKWIMIILLVILLIGGIVININNKEFLFKDKKVYNYSVNYEDNQLIVNSELESYVNDKNITFDNPKVVVDPYNNSKLAAMIIFYTEEDTEIKLYINGHFMTTMESGHEHIIPVYGLKEEYNNEIVIINNKNEEKKINIKTNKIDSSIMYKYNSTRDISDNLFINSPMGKFSLDGEGNINWYNDNGNYEFIITDDKKIYLLDRYNRLLETDFMGRVTRMYYVYLTSNNHQIVKLSNNNIMAIDSSFSISEIDYETGKVETVFNLIDVLMNVDKDIDITNEIVYMNHFQYDEVNKTLLISIRGLDTIIKYDLVNEKIIWMISNNSVFSDKFNEYKLNLSNDVTYFIGQHSPYMDGDYLYVFDNGNCYFNDNNSFNSLNKSSAVIYEVKGDNLYEVYRYTGDVASGWYGNFYVYKDIKHINFGSIVDDDRGKYSKVIELDKDNNITMELVTEYKNILIYESGRYNFYNDVTSNYNINNDFKKIDANNYKKVYYFEADNEEEAVEREKKDLTLYKDNIYNKLKGALIDRGMIKVSKELGIEIDTSEDYQVLFVNKDYNFYKISMKNDGYRYLYLNDFISKIKGEYAIYIIINGKYYDTGVVFDIR